MTYDPPMSKDEIIRRYGRVRAYLLLRYPAHRWRAETGIELIHKELTLEEQFRIWRNWQAMPKSLKILSDIKSLQLFGKTNAEHHRELMRRFRSRR